MSSTMNIKCQIRDMDALKSACDMLGYRMQKGKHMIYHTESVGMGVWLPNFRFPVVVKADGTVDMDTYKGNWGNEKELHKLEAYYGIEKAKSEALSLGYSVEESYDSVTKELLLNIDVGGL